MPKSLKKRSDNPTSNASKDLFKEALDRITTEKHIIIDKKLEKAFQKFLNSGSKEKIDHYSDKDRDTSVNLFLLSAMTVLLEKNTKLQNELFQVTDAYEDVVALITHEFKNVLTSVHGYNMMMEKELEENNKKEIADVLRSSDRLTRQLFDMSDSLLKMSLGEKGLLNPENKLINFVEDILIPIEKDIRGTVNEKNMNIIINKPSGDSIIEGDDGLLNIVLRNLLINALKYGKHSSEILVSIERVKSVFKLTVKNECEKIPENFCQNIFQKFTTKKVGNVKGGTGLGLYNVKKIIDLHRGTVNCNVIKNRWIEFEITLPQNIL